jgi:hypothetical protein
MANGIEGANNGPDDTVVNFSAELQAKAQGYKLEATQGQLNTFTSAVEAGSPGIKAAAEAYELKKIDAPMINAPTGNLDVAGAEAAFNKALLQKIEDAKSNLAVSAAEANRAALGGKLAEKPTGIVEAMAQVEAARAEKEVAAPTNFGLSEVVTVNPVPTEANMYNTPVGTESAYNTPVTPGTPDAPTSITSAE